MEFKLDRRKACPVEKYAKQVLSGKITAGKYVKLACQRHLDDLKNAADRGFTFDRAASERAIFMIETLRHTKGEWAGQRIRLEGWQKFIIGSIFGWKNAETGYRRFRDAYNQLARKNGKSTLGGGLGIVFMAGDKEPGAQVYCVATKKDQAMIVFDEAKSMINALPAHYDLRKLVKVWSSLLQVEKNGSFMKPLGSDSKTQDGLNPHAAIIDEFHAHPSREMLDVIKTALAARRQPFIFIITTAGFDMHSACYEQRDYATKVLEGIIDNDSLFVYIAEIDEDDDPFDEKVWIKANPNLGVSVKMDYLREQAKTARGMPSFYNEFLTKNLNKWTETEEIWIKSEQWKACSKPVDLDFLRTRPCYGGLDLSSTTDLSSFVKVWPPYEDDPHWYVHPRFWLPEDDLQARIRRDRAPYDVWARDGFLNLTAGNVIDHEFIQAAIEDDWDNFEIADVGFDRYNATMIVTRLQGAGVEMVGFGQGYVSMSPAVKEAERIILQQLLAHGGHPLLAWMCSNTVLTRDPAGNVKPDKSKSRSRIDGIVAMLMAIGRASTTPEVTKSHTVTHGVVVI